jgi:exonuclease SbcD
MRILHTSDWHLGKRLFKLDRTPEHQAFLDWLVPVLIQEKIDILLIAGDIFDTPTPPHQALELFYNFLHRVSVETNTETLIISGNHDSGLLLEAPSKLLSPHRVRVWGKISENPDDHWHKAGPLDICALPFFRSYELLPSGQGDIISALSKYLVREKKGPQVLMLHHLAGMFEAAGSEQVIHLSGIDSIPTELMKKFDYVALGHIHKPQKISTNAWYSGSPIPLRFSEAAKKSLMALEIQGDSTHIRSIPIPQFRDFFTIRTNEQTYQADLNKIKSNSPLSGMVEVQIKLTAPKVGLIDEIKNILSVNDIYLLSFVPIYETIEQKERKTEKLFEMNPIEIFSEFYSRKFPEAHQVPEDLLTDFKILLEKVKNATSSS